MQSDAFENCVQIVEVPAAQRVFKSVWGNSLSLLSISNPLGTPKLTATSQLLQNTQNGMVLKDEPQESILTGSGSPKGSLRMASPRSCLSSIWSASFLPDASAENPTVPSKIALSPWPWLQT